MEEESQSEISVLMFNMVQTPITQDECRRRLAAKNIFPTSELRDLGHNSVRKVHEFSFNLPLGCRVAADVVFMGRTGVQYHLPGVRGVAFRLERSRYYR